MTHDAVAAAQPDPILQTSVWTITDGKAGMEVQVEGVAQALCFPYDVKRVNARGPWRALAPWIGPDPRDRFGLEDGQFAPPFPDLAVATGRLSIPVIRAIKRASPHTFTVVIQDPRSNALADLIAVPEHDTLTGHNVVRTLTAPHTFSPARLARLRANKPRQLAELPGKLVVVVLGGPNKVYKFTETDSQRLATALTGLAKSSVSFLVTASRRTPEHTLTAISRVIEQSPHIIWRGQGDNPYDAWLAHGDAFIVTADSVNMTGEACVTGKPVYVFHPQGGSKKFTRFHENLRRYGATKPLPDRLENLESWTYTPLDSAAQIAAEIRRRWPKSGT